MSPRRQGSPPRAVFWTRRAQADLEAIGDFIARDKPLAAERWVGTLVAAADAAAEAPMVGRRVPELGRDDVREVLVQGYRVIYRVTTERLEVLTVFHGRRRFPDDLGSG